MMAHAPIFLLAWYNTIQFLYSQNNHLELFKMADLNFGCATFCALPSFGAVTTFSSHTTVSSQKVRVEGSDIDMCSGYIFFSIITRNIVQLIYVHTL